MISDKIFNLLSIGLGALAFGKAKGKDLTLDALRTMITGTNASPLAGETLSEFQGGTFFDVLSQQNRNNNRRANSNDSLAYTVNHALSSEQLAYLFDQHQKRFAGDRVRGGGLSLASRFTSSTPMGATGVPGGIPILGGPTPMKNFTFAADGQTFIGQQAEATRQTILDIMTNKRFSGMFTGTQKQRSYDSLLKRVQSESFGPMNSKAAQRGLKPILNSFNMLYGGVEGMSDTFAKRLHGNRAMFETGSRGLLKFSTANNSLSNVSFLSNSDLTTQELERVKDFESQIRQRGVGATFDRSNIVEINQKIGASDYKKFRYAQYRIGDGDTAESIMIPVQDLAHYVDESTGGQVYHRDAAGSVMYSPTGKVMRINKDKSSEVMSGLEYLFGKESKDKAGRSVRSGGQIMSLIDKSMKQGQRIGSSLFGGKDVEVDDQYKILQYVDPARTPSRALSLKAAQMKVVRSMNPMDPDADIDASDASRLSDFDEISRQAASHNYVIEPLTSPNQTRKDIFNWRGVERDAAGQIVSTNTPDYIRAALGEVDPSTGEFYSVNDIGRRPGRHIINAYNVENRGSQRALGHLRATLGDLYAFRGSGAFADMEKSGMIGFVHGSWLTTKRSMRENPQAVPEGTRIRVGASEGEQVVHPGRHFTVDKSTKGDPASREAFSFNAKFKGIIDAAEAAGTGDAAARQAAIRRELEANPILLNEGDWLGKSVEGDNITDVTVNVPGQGRLAVLDVIPGMDDYTFSIGRVSGFGEGTKTFGATTSTESSLFDERLSEAEKQLVKDFSLEQKNEFYTKAKESAKANKVALYDQEVQRRAPEVAALEKALDQLADKKKAATAQKKILGERRKFTRGEEKKFMGNLRGGALEKAYEGYKATLDDRASLDQERELLEGLPEIFPAGPKGPSMTKRLNKNKKSIADFDGQQLTQRKKYTVPESEMLDAMFPTRPSFGKGTETGSISLFDLIAERDQLLKTRKQKPPRLKDMDFQAKAIGEVQSLFNIHEEANFWHKNKSAISWLSNQSNLSGKDQAFLGQMQKYFGGVDTGDVRADGTPIYKNSINQRLKKQQKKVRVLNTEFVRRGFGPLAEAERYFRDNLERSRAGDKNKPSWMSAPRTKLESVLLATFNRPANRDVSVLERISKKYKENPAGWGDASTNMIEEILGIDKSQRSAFGMFFNVEGDPDPDSASQKYYSDHGTGLFERGEGRLGPTLNSSGIPLRERKANKRLMKDITGKIGANDAEREANLDRLKQVNKMIAKGKTIAYKRIAADLGEKEAVKKFGTVAEQIDLKPQREAHIAALKQIKEELAGFKDQLPGYDPDATKSGWESIRDSVRTGKINDIVTARSAPAIENAFNQVDPAFMGSTAANRTLPFTTFIGEGRNFTKGTNIRQIRTQQESAIGFLLNRFDADNNPTLGLQDIRNYAGDISSPANPAYQAFHAGMRKGLGDENYSLEDTNALISYLKRAQDAFKEDPSLLKEREQLLGNVFGFEQGGTDQAGFRLENLIESDPQALLDLGLDQDFVDSLGTGIKNAKQVFNLSLHGVADSSSVIEGNNARMERRFIDHVFYQLMDSQNERHGHMKKVWETIQQRVMTYDPGYVEQLGSFAKNAIRETTKKDRVLDLGGTDAEDLRRKALSAIRTKGGFLKHGKDQIYIPAADELRKLSLTDSRAGRHVEDTDLEEMITEILRTVETNITDVDKKTFATLRGQLMQVGARKGMEAFNAPFEGRLRGAEYGMVIANLDDKVAKETQGYGVGLSRRVIDEHFNEAMRTASKSERNYLKKMKKGVLEEGKYYAVMGWQNPQIGPESVSTMAGYYDARRDRTGGYTANLLGEKVDFEGAKIWKRIGGFITGKTSSDFDGDTAAVMMVGAGDRNRSGKNISDYWQQQSDLISQPSLSKQYQRQKNYGLRSQSNEATLEKSFKDLLKGPNISPTRKQEAFLRQAGQEDVGLISNTARAMHRINYIMKGTGGIDSGSSEEMTNFLQALEQKAVGFKHMAVSPRAMLYQRFHSAISNENVEEGFAQYKSLVKDLGFRDADKIDTNSDQALGAFSLARASLVGGGQKAEKMTAEDALNSFLSGSADSDFALHQLDSDRSDMLLNFAMSALPKGRQEEFKKKVNQFKEGLTGRGGTALGDSLSQLNQSEKARAAARVKNASGASLARAEIKEAKESSKSLFANKFARAGMVGAAVMAGAYALFNSGYDDEPLTDLPPPPPGRMMMTPTNADMQVINSGNLLSDNYSSYNRGNDEEMARTAGSPEMSGTMSAPNSIAAKSYLNNANVRISNRGMIVDKTNPVEYARAIQGIIPGAQVGVSINHNYNIPTDLEREL